jgi:hypothetical protein
MVRKVFTPPNRFYEFVKGPRAEPRKLVAAMRAVGFDVFEDPETTYWIAYVDDSVNHTVRLTDRAFVGADAVQFALLAWRVHVDDAVQAALRLGGDEAALALLTSEWVRAQDLR